jgi:uncharacterized protein YjdB
VGSDNDAYFDAIKFVVSDKKYKTVTITSNTAAAQVGDTVQLTATNGDSTKPTDYSWSTSYSATATVDENGLVTFLATDEVIVYATHKETGVVGEYAFKSPE